MKDFRILVTIAAIILLLICAMGMTGYLSDEMNRRSREIAVRKVNGASTASVIRLMCKSILVISIPAVTIGILAAWYFSRMWLKQFTVTLNHITLRFIAAGICTVLLILCIAFLLTFKKASVNPVVNLRSE